MDPLNTIAKIAASGMTAQTDRLRIVSENVANADSTGTTPGADPYRRKTVTFAQMLDRDTGATGVEIGQVGRDDTPFQLDYDPSHPAADANGYVKRPNVDPVLEMANMREASRSYEANMNLFEAGRRMRGQMLDMLK